MLRTGRIALALALAASTSTLAACGGDEGGTIPQANSDALLQEVDQLQQQVASGDCSLASATADRITEGVNELPKEVGVETKDDLRDLSLNLEDLVSSQCEAPETTTTDETETTTPTTTSSTTTTSTSTTTTETDTETEEPPEQEPDEGNGVPGGGNEGENGTGNGEGNGGSSGGTSGGVEG